jgi:hypothetical protein
MGGTGGSRIDQQPSVAAQVVGGEAWTPHFIDLDQTQAGRRDRSVTNRDETEFMPSTVGNFAAAGLNDESRLNRRRT